MCDVCMERRNFLFAAYFVSGDARWPIMVCRFCIDMDVAAIADRIRSSSHIDEIMKRRGVVLSDKGSAKCQRKK